MRLVRHRFVLANVSVSEKCLDSITGTRTSNTSTDGIKDATIISNRNQLSEKYIDSDLLMTPTNTGSDVVVP